MRLKRYITEKDEWLKDAVDKISKDCKPWLKESKLLPGYRASNKNISAYISKGSVRSDRRPLTTDQQIHTIVNNLFKKHYGWFARSNVLFVQGKANQFYGPHTYAIYPIGKIKYLWSTKILDITPDIEDLKDIMMEDGVDDTHPDYYSILKNDIDDMIKGAYKSTDLHGALEHYPRNEIMVNCKEYYIVPEVFDIFVGKALHARFN